MNEMTVSVSKGKAKESSISHNDRKTRLKNATKDKKKKFYEQKGHEHIHPEYTNLNVDYVKDVKDVYNKYFEDAVKKYNDNKSRDDRKIGAGKAVTCAEKKLNIVVLEKAIEFRKHTAEERRQLLKDFQPKDAEDKAIKVFLERSSNVTRRDLRKQLTQAKHAKTLGEALYDKQKQSKRAKTHVEFVMQVGSAEDFNEVDENGKIIKSYDRTDPNGVWQKAKKTLLKYEKKFEKQNPNLIVYNYSIHMDENTPHMHLDCVPVAEVAKTTQRGKKRNGLAVKPTLDGALECEGFKKDPKDSRKAFKAWQNRESDTLAQIMEEELGVSRKKGVTNRLKDVHEYKKYKKQHIEQQKEIQSNNLVIARQNLTISDTTDELVKQSEKLKTATDTLKKTQEKTANLQVQLDVLEKRRKEQEKREKELKEKEKKLAERENTIDRKSKDLKSVNRELNKRAKILDERESKLQKLENKFKKVTKSVSKFFKHYYRTVFEDEGFSKSGLDHYSTIYAESPYLAENVSKSFSEHAFKQALPDLKDVTENLGALNVAFNEHDNRKLTREAIKNLNKNTNKEDNINNISDNVNTASSVKSEGGARTDNVHDTRKERVKIHYHDAPESPDDDIFDMF